MSKTRLMVRGWKNGALAFEQPHTIEDNQIDRVLGPLGEKHATALMGEPHMIEIEFLDEPDPLQRFFRMGTDKSAIPGYWMNETSGVLRPIVEAYLRGDRLTREQVPTMRAYLRRWINAGDCRACGLGGQSRSTQGHRHKRRWTTGYVNKWLNLLPNGRALATGASPRCCKGKG